MKHDEGTAGLNLFLSLIVSLFVIGLIVMIFAIVGGGLTEASYTSTSASPTGEVLTNVNDGAATSFAVASYQDVTCSSPVFYNQTGGETIGSSNYSVSGCSVTALDWVNTSTVTYELLENVTNLSAVSFAVSGYDSVNCSSVSVHNQTDGVIILETGNYSVTACTITAISGSPYMGTYKDNAYNWTVNYTYSFVDASPYNATNWLVNYTYVYNADNDATQTIGNTTEAVASAVDWFDIFIVIGAMVVLILLTVVIIAAIRGSGLITQSTA